MKNLKAVLSGKIRFNLWSGRFDNRLFRQDLAPFSNVPGLIQKYYITEEATGAKGGIYIF